jgi:hypothetical protein
MKSSNANQNFFSNWGTLKHGDSQGSILGPLFSIMYIKNFPQTTITY